MERYGDFELQRLIATGGMAELYLAKEGAPGGPSRMVVVKRILPQLAARPDFVAMFRDEARLAASLHHPNIVSVIKVGEVDNSCFIAMEFVDGPHLGSLFAHSLRRRKPLPIDHCAYIVARAADGLHFAHEHRDPATGHPVNCVHRDVSPQNILVSLQADVKVTDFGVAKASTQQSKTRIGVIKGKVAYMSPEQCLGDIVDRRTDVFALGIVLYELLTRRRLFRDKSDLLIMQRITGEDTAPASSINKEVDADLDLICTRALARDREARFQSAAELAEALDAWSTAKQPGDTRAHLQRWFKNNALELTIAGSPESSSSPQATEVRPAPLRADEGSAAPLSSISAEAVLRAASPHIRSAPGAAGASDTRAERTQPEPTHIEDEPTDLSGASSALGPAGGTIEAAQANRVAPSDPRASFEVTAIGAKAERARRKLPLAALAGGGAVLGLAIAVGVFALGPPPAPPGAQSAVGESSTFTRAVPPGISVVVDQLRLQLHDAGRVLEADERAADDAMARDRLSLNEEIVVEPSDLRVLAKTPAIVKSSPPKGRQRSSARRRPPEPKFGLLNMRSTPWVLVKIGRTQIGSTTFVNSKVPAGRQTLILSNPEVGLKQTLVVVIPEDKALNVSLEWEKKGDDWSIHTRSIE